jgi:thioredoxin-related protein
MKTFLSLALILSSSLLANAADWTTDYAAALVKAKAEKKLVLLDFTGSDWCGYCKLLDKEVFPTPTFNDFADKNYVLVTVDFPKQKQLPDDLQKQNQALGDKFGVEGFPTLIVVDPTGKELGRQTGYDPGSGPDAVVGKLKSFSK